MREGISPHDQIGGLGEAEGGSYLTIGQVSTLCTGGHGNHLTGWRECRYVGLHPASSGATTCYMGILLPTT